MKRNALLSVILTIFAAALSVAAGLFAPWEMDGALTAPPENPDNLTEPPRVWEDHQVVIRVLDGGAIVEMTLEDYLAGVVAAEMPVLFEPDALAAQAVAARTYTLFNIEVQPRHGDADVCTDFTHCAAFLSDAAMRERWGGDYAANLATIRAAVRETAGVYMTYGGEIVLAVFHSSSHGSTENSESVWGRAYPYLVSVQTPESDETTPNFTSTVTVSLSDFTETISRAHTDASFSGEPATWLGEIEYGESGRVRSAVIGGVALGGTELRALFGLRSTAVSIEIGDAVVFTTSGYGHGVGMSQYGANVMAANGAGWREILRAYYTGVAFSDELAGV